jgi:hypothetical protein
MRAPAGGADDLDLGVLLVEDRDLVGRVGSERVAALILPEEISGTV